MAINKNLFPGNDGRSRIKRSSHTVVNPCGENMKFLEEKTLTQHPSGSIESLESTTSFILTNTGEKVTSQAAIKGVCHICGGYITAFSVRFCRYCGQLTCAVDARFIEEKGHYACSRCAKKLKFKKMISGALKIITSPFIEREIKNEKPQ